MTLYIAFNGPMATTAAPAPVTTGTAVKTMLQIATPSTKMIKPVWWGISFSGFAAAAPIVCELVQTDVAATVTAHIASGVQPYDDPGAPASVVTLGTSATGYTSTAEGTITATRHADLKQVSPTTQYDYLWPLGREFKVAISRFLRVRVTAAAAVNATCFVVWEE
ncbi:hypothetical protein [Nonomuraea sp. NPDC049158]|uniref:hypothetical protein n=1 Tax=Nonomuraea sp. NPDC049158 TaxID=3155649 RepID=UPI0033D8ACC0